MATVRWTGAALDVADVWTFVVQDTWAQGDTATVTINGKDLTLTVGSTATTTQIADDITDMINGAAVNNDETRNETGDNVAEFQDITASFSGSTVTLTGDVKGEPHTVTVSEVTAGTGTLASLTNATAATGKEHWDDADNWDGGAVPVATDDVYLDNYSGNIKYGLSNAGATLTSLTIHSSFTGQIGLPKTNANGYPEYRTEYLTVDVTTLKIGQGLGQGSNRIKIDLGTVQSTIEVYKSGNSAEQGIPAIILKGTNANNALETHGGNVGVGYFGGEAATIKTLLNSGATIEFGENVTLNGAGSTIQQTRGEMITRSATITVTIDGGLYIQTIGNITTLNHNVGTVDYRGAGTITTATLYDLLTVENDVSSRTITTCNLGKGGRIRDPSQTITYTNGIAVGTGTDEITAS